MGLLIAVLDDCHLCVARTSIRHLSIDHQLFHPSSVNGHLFLIRLTGGAGAIPSSHGARGKNTRWTGCQSVTRSLTHIQVLFRFSSQTSFHAFGLWKETEALCFLLSGLELLLSL